MTFGLLILAQIGGLFLLSRALDRHLSGVMMRIFRSPSATIKLMAVLFWPGTLVHELAHLIVARLLLVKAGKLTIIPKVERDHVAMGSVMVARTDPVRRLVIGVAPVLVGIATILTTFWLAGQYGLWNLLAWQIVIGYIVFEVGNTMFSSKADMEGALGLLAFIAAVIGIAYWLGWRPSLEWILPLLDHHQDLLGRISQWLWLPIIIDAMVVACLWIV